MKSIQTNAFRLFLLALALAALPSHAQVYRWVDKDGKVQYSDKPPPEGAAKSGVKMVDTKPASNPDAKAPPPETKDNWKERDLDFRARRLAAQQQQAKEEEEAKAAARAAEDRKKRCISAQGRLKDLQEIGPIYNRNDKGEKVYIPDSDRDAEIAKAKETVSRLCN